MTIRLAIIAWLLLSFAPVLAGPDLSGRWRLLEDCWTGGEPHKDSELVLTDRTVALHKESEMQGAWSLSNLRWTAGSGPRMQVRLELLPGGQARFESFEIVVGYAETTDGECVAFTTQTNQQKLEGTYQVKSDSLIFRWRETATGLVPVIDGVETWPYRLDEELMLTFPDRVLALGKDD